MAVTYFSILQPAHNYARFLPEAITSVLGQSYDDFEFIIIDDCSTDDTWDIVQSFKDPRIVAVQQAENRGMTATLNHGLRIASGEAIAVIGADDVYHRDFLARVHAEFAASGPEVGAVSVYLRGIDADGHPLAADPAGAHFNQPWDFGDPATWVWQNHFAGCAAVRREVFDTVGEFSEDIASAMDWDLWIRMLAAGYSLRVVPEVLFDWRLHGENITNRSVLQTLADYSLISERHLHPYLASIGRHDLIATNAGIFLTHRGLIEAEPAFTQTVVSRVLSSLPESDQAAAVRAAGFEVDRLRRLAEQGTSLRDDLAQANEALREREYELQAALDRLGAAEADRRQAHAELERWQSTAIYRAARKAKRAVRK
jgi:glycosyltransferase involved in cell wall biosynthesis